VGEGEGGIDGARESVRLVTPNSLKLLTWRVLWDFPGSFIICLLNAQEKHYRCRYWLLNFRILFK